jgi:glycosyltransferase involved in cell wall biosynthesis
VTANPKAYERTSEDLLREIPSTTEVCRAFALDTARHLSLRGRYLAAMARPDRWMSWKFDAVRQGMRLIRQHRPDAIWSTYPIATAHLIGAELTRRSGLPWVADFRDPMAQEGYPTDPLTWQQYRDIERHTLTHASLSTFTTPGAASDYRLRYPQAAARVSVLENGYDEETFARAGDAAALGPLVPGCLTLLHSGIVYPSERDPTQLMAALRILADAGTLVPGRLRVRFRAAVAEDLLRRLAQQHGVQDFIEICPPVDYQQALSEMLRADALLVLQASNCNAQIPAKLYEYFRAGRPLLCLADPAGDTAGAVRAAGIETIAPLDDAPAIATLIARFMTPTAHVPTMVGLQPQVRAASRAGRAQALAQLLDRIAKTHHDTQ